VVAGLATLVLVTLLTGLSTTTSQWLRAKKSSEEAKERAEGEAVARQTAEQALLSERKAREQTRRSLYASDMILAGMAWSENNFGRVDELLMSYCPKELSRDDDYFEWYLLWGTCQRRLNSHTVSLSTPIAAFDISPDKKTIALSYSYGGVILMDLATRLPLTTFGGNIESFYTDIQFATTGNALAYVSTPDTHVTVRNLDTGEEVSYPCFDEGSIESLSLSAADRFLAVAGKPGVRIWDIRDAELIRKFDGCGWHDKPTADVAFSPNADFLAVATKGRLLLGRISEGAEDVVELLPDEGIYCTEFSPDGTTLVAGYEDGGIRLCNVTDLSVGEKLDGAHKRTVTCIAFSADGRLIATGSIDYAIRLWDADTLTELGSLKGHSGSVYEIALLPDGGLISAASDSTVTIWPPNRTRQGSVFPHFDGPVDGSFVRNRVAVAPDQKRWAMPFEHGIRIFDWTGNIQAEESLPVEDLTCIALSNGPAVAIGYGAGKVQIRQVGTGEDRFLTSPQKGIVSAIAFSEGGDDLIIGRRDGTLQRWNIATDDCVTFPREHTDAIQHVAFAMNGREFVSCSNDQTIRLWSLETGRQVLKVGEHTGFVRSLAYSPDGRWLASGGFDTQVRIWDMSSRPPKPRTLKAHASGAFAVAFSPNGHILATGGRDGEVRLWDVESLRERLVMKCHKARIHRVAFSPDGWSLLTSSRDGTTRIWRAATPAEVEASQWWRDVIAEAP
jgi:WD40 repeat protein